MFSGIVKELGRVVANEAARSGRLHLASSAAIRGARQGDSVAVNGCCLTLVALSDGGFEADVMPETARRTTLGELAPGDAVNLEPSLALGDRVGGHLVTGHVDAVGTVTDLQEEGGARRVTVAAGDEVMALLAPRGSVAVDGISLTVVETGPDRFTVSLIPHTLSATTAGGWRPGSRVNVEADLVARYVHRACRAALEASP